MVNMGGMGSVWGGLSGSAIGYMTSIGNRKFETQQRGLTRNMRERNFAFNDTGLHNQQNDLNRNTTYQQSDIASGANERGLTNSSIPVAQHQLVEDDRSRRYKAIQYQRDVNKANYTDETAMMDSQREQAKFNRTMQMMNSMVQGGASGVISSYGGGQNG
jgi:hypothetical protein